MNFRIMSQVGEGVRGWGTGYRRGQGREERERKGERGDLVNEREGGRCIRILADSAYLQSNHNALIQ